jgi:hypothetical protein
MARVPTSLGLSEVKCITTDDAVGNDEIFACFKDISSNTLGKIRIGFFQAGTTSGLQTGIPPGAITLELWEDDFWGNDFIGSIDLTEDMDRETERSVTLTNGSAKYEIQLFVTSELTSD